MLDWYRRVIVTCIALALPALAAAAPAGTSAPIDRTIARVDGAPIWESELDLRMLSPSAKPRATELDMLIEEELLIGEAKRKRIDVSKAEVLAALDDIKRQNNLDDAQLDTILKQQGYTRARYLVALERQLMILRAQNQLLMPRVMVSDAEIAAEGKARKLPAPLSEADKETVKRDLRKQARDAQAVTWVAELHKGAWIERRGAQAAKPVTTKPADLTGPVKKVTVKGASTAVQNALLADLASVRDKPLDPDQLRDLVAPAITKPGIADLDVRAVQLAAGIEVVIDVTAEPVLRGLSAIEVDSRKPIAIEIPKPASGVPLDAKRVQEIATRLHYDFRSTGHMDAAVSWRRVPVTGGVDVVIEVKAGVGSTIGSVGFTGNTLEAKALLAQASKWLVVGDPVLEDNLRVTVTVLEAYYFDRGFVLAKIKWLKPTAGKAAIVFEIAEGPQFRVGAITIKGRPTAEHERYLKTFGVKPGDLFSRKAISDGRQRVIDALKADGKRVTDVAPVTNLDLDKRTIGLMLDISATP